MQLSAVRSSGDRELFLDSMADYGRGPWSKLSWRSGPKLLADFLITPGHDGLKADGLAEPG